MKIPLRLEYVNGKESQVVTPSPMAMIGWEKWSGRRMTDLSSDSGGMGMSDMVRMAYEQVKLEGGTADEFEEWATTLADIDPEGGEDPPSGDEEA